MGGRPAHDELIPERQGRLHAAGWVPGTAPENAWEGGFSSAAREIPCELAACLRFLWLAEATFLSRRSCARTPEPFARPIFSLKVRNATLAAVRSPFVRSQISRS